MGVCMRVFLVRHGQTDGNKKELIQGWLDLKLNETGINQSKLLAKRLKKENIDVFYSSDLKRAVMTTDEIKKYFPGKPWIRSKILRERNFGILEGVHVKHYYELLDSYGIKNYEFRPPFGESYLDVRRRAELFFREIKRKYAGQNVVVVSHGAFNRAFLSYLMDISLKDAMEIHQENTCVNIIEVKGKPKVIALNDFSHLNGNVF